MIVLDASVAAKWFLPEVGTVAAQKLLTGKKKLIAPTLIKIEVAAAIIRAYRENRMSETIACDCHQAWEQMLNDQIIHLISNEELYEIAVKIAFDIKHSLQDCLYLAAGKVTKAEVMTADKLFADRGSRAIKNIALISDRN